MGIEAEFGVEFWEEGKHVITLSIKARSALDAWDYAEGQLADMNCLEVIEGREPLTFVLIRQDLERNS